MAQAPDKLLQNSDYNGHYTLIKTNEDSLEYQKPNSPNENVYVFKLWRSQADIICLHPVL